MSFLKLNGLVIPAGIAEAKKTPILVGDKGKTFSGSPRETVRRRLREWSFAVTPQTYALADALRQWINGDGDRWTFDSDLYSARGVGPSGSSGATAAVSSGKWNKKLTLAATSGQATWDIASSVWTVALWYLEGATWNHYIVRSDANTDDGCFGNGVQVDPVDVDLSWNGTTTAHVKINNTTGSTKSYDDLVFLPYLLPSEWAAGFYTQAAAKAWSTLPRLYLDGDVIAGGSSVTVKGEVGESTIQVFSSNGTLNTNGETFPFTLTEV